MNVVQGNLATSDTFLDQFHEFYVKLLGLRREVEQRFPLHDDKNGRLSPSQTEAMVQAEATAAVDKPAGHEDDLQPVSAQKGFMEAAADLSFTVSSFLRDQEAQTLSTYGQYAGLNYKEVQYALAAFADEFFLSADWQGRGVWDQTLVEMNLFNSHVAGDVIFERIDEYLSVSSSNASHTLGVIYYYILSLGFMGKYRGQKDAGQAIASYKNRLFSLIVKRKPRLFGGKYELFAQAYDHTIVTGKDHKIISPKWWWGAFAALICVMFVLSHLVWVSSTADLNVEMEKILNYGLLQAQ